MLQLYTNAIRKASADRVTAFAEKAGVLLPAYAKHG
jgi:hypothetical protein